MAEHTGIQNKDYISQSPFQVDVVMWLCLGQ